MQLSFLAPLNPQTMSLYFKAGEKGGRTNARDFFQHDSVAGSVYSPDKVAASNTADLHALINFPQLLNENIHVLDNPGYVPLPKTAWI